MSEISTATLTDEPPAEVTRFAPARMRANTLLTIHGEIRQELDRHKRAMDDLGTKLRTHVDELLRANG